jgi:hypothetical protein
VKATHDPDAWFRQPVLWLGIAILVASLLGCIATIVIATRNADVPEPVSGAPRR